MGASRLSQIHIEGEMNVCNRCHGRVDYQPNVSVSVHLPQASEVSC